MKPKPFVLDFDVNRKKPRPRHVVSFDLETYLMAPCVQAPPAVAMGFSVDGGPVHVVAANDEAFDAIVEELFSNPNYLVVGHNVAFDLAVLMAHGAKRGRSLQWARLVMTALNEDRVVCTMVRERLIRIAMARPQDFAAKYDLGACCERWHTPTQPDKSDPFRLLWGTLAAQHVRDYPPEAVNYLVADVRATAELFGKQASKDPWLLDQYRQTRAAMALHLMTCWGFKTDPVQAAKLVADTEAELQAATATAQAWGLVRPDGTRNKKAAEARMLQVCTDMGLDVPRGKPTAAMLDKDPDCLGNIKLDDEACEATKDEALLAYSKVSQSVTLLAKAQRYLKPVIQASFTSLVNTGRTSCNQGSDPKPGEAPRAHGAQMQNLPRAEGARECFVARPGKKLVSVDYDAFEMSSLAQVWIDKVGYSALAEILADPKRDMHVEMAAKIHGMDPSEVYAMKKTDPKRYKEIRQIGKPANFGLPGGLGARKFVDFCWAGYGLRITEQQAREIKKAWSELYPESVVYFRQISDALAAAPDGRYRMRQLRSDRYRGDVGFTDASNGHFQGLAADAAKEALWRLTVEMYCCPHSPLFGARMVAFVHDEAILEVSDAVLHEAAHRQAEVMVEGAKAYMPSVRVSASPAAMARWTKAADAVYKDGRLIAWEDRT